MSRHGGNISLTCRGVDRTAFFPGVEHEMNQSVGIILGILRITNARPDTVFFRRPPVFFGLEHRVDILRNNHGNASGVASAAIVAFAHHANTALSTGTRIDITLVRVDTTNAVGGTTLPLGTPWPVGSVRIRDFQFVGTRVRVGRAAISAGVEFDFIRSVAARKAAGLVRSVDEFMRGVPLEIVVVEGGKCGDVRQCGIERHYETVDARWNGRGSRG
mmetsp:Transcript_13090/g.23739  ORF Transcript_13090/g.23739 Transcript_13090/m.23739 type:complete len:217 (+) Transcript_13090:1849-2499(+)